MMWALLKSELYKFADLYNSRSESNTKLKVDFVERYILHEDLITLEEKLKGFSFLDKILNIDTILNLCIKEIALTQEKTFLTPQKQYLTEMLFELLGNDITKNLESLKVEEEPLCICIYSVESSEKLPLLYIIRKSCDIGLVS